MNAELKSMFKRLPARHTLAVAALILLAGCAAQMEHRNGLSLISDGEPVKGVESLRRATELDPKNASYKLDFLNQKTKIVNNLLDRADAKREAGALDLASQLYQQAVAIEPSNARGLTGLRRIDSETRAEPLLNQADQHLQLNKVESALDIARRVLRDLPQNVRAQQVQRVAEERLETERLAREEQLAAKAAFRRPVTLSFRDSPLKMVFEALSRVANINVVFDRDVKTDVKTTIFVKNAAIEDAIDVILMQNQLEKRTLNGNTILVYPSTAAKQKELAELKVRTFHLSNIDAGLMANIIKAMVKTKDIVTDTKSNMLVMRDTVDAVALAERLVAANDLPDPEVMLEVHVLEVASSRNSEIGVKLPTAFSLTTPSVGSGATTTTGTGATASSSSGFTLGDLRALRSGDLLVSPMSVTLNMMLTDSDTTILASPRIRTRNKEKARILVGDKLPQITNLISPQQTGQNSVITGSVQYVDVGIKLDVEPEVYADGDVGIKLNLEVSNVTATITTQSGQAYQIGTRSAQTNLRLRDGETQVMAGLINDTDRNSAQRVPGLGQLPVLGRLFSSQGGDTKKTEIVLAITPHIVRPHAQPDLRNADAWSGSESSIRDRQLRIDTIGALKLEPSKPDVPRPVAAPAAPVMPRLAPTPAAVPTIPVPAEPPPADGAVAPTAAPAPIVPPVSGEAAAAAATMPSVVDGRPRPTARPLPGRTPIVPPQAPEPEGPAPAADKP